MVEIDRVMGSAYLIDNEATNNPKPEIQSKSASQSNVSYFFSKSVINGIINPSHIKHKNTCKK